MMWWRQRRGARPVELALTPQERRSIEKADDALAIVEEMAADLRKAARLALAGNRKPGGGESGRRERPGESGSSLAG